MTKYLATTLASLVFCAACSSSVYQIKEPMKSVGLAINIEPEKLCHRYVGVMVWNNFVREYDLPMDLEGAIVERIRQSLGSRGINVQLLPYEEISEGNQKLLKWSHWDGSFSVLPEYMDNFNRVVQERRVDTVFVVSSAHLNRFDDCDATMLYGNASAQGPRYVTVPSLRVFSPTGIYAGSISFSLVDDEFTRPEDGKELDDDFLEHVVARALEMLESELAQYAISRGG